MQKTDQKMDVLADQVTNIESELFSEDGSQVEVMTLLQSVTEVKNNYQNLRKEIVEVQHLQKQLSSTLQIQLQAMQSKFNTLKEKLMPVKNENAQLPHASPGKDLDDSYWSSYVVCYATL